jgi:hypothetical protein
MKPWSSVDSVGDSDDALAETINGLFKTEMIHRRGRWRSADTVEFATLVWVDWFNNRRLWSWSEISRPPRRKRAIMPKATSTPWWRDSNQTASGKPGAVHHVLALSTG